MRKRKIEVALQKITVRDFCSRPVVGTLFSNEQGVGSIPGQEAEVPHASWPKNRKRKQAIL